MLRVQGWLAGKQTEPHINLKGKNVCCLACINSNTKMYKNQLTLLKQLNKLQSLLLNKLYLHQMCCLPVSYVDFHAILRSFGGHYRTIHPYIRIHSFILLGRTSSMRKKNTAHHTTSKRQNGTKIDTRDKQRTCKRYVKFLYKSIFNI